MASAVQFVGLTRVLSAFRNRNVPAWSIFCGKQFLTKYEPDAETQEDQIMNDSENMLSEYLGEICKSGTNAIYTLKVYEEYKDRIKSNTPDDGSFNFRLNEPEMQATVGMVQQYVRNNEIMSEITAIKQQLAQMVEDDEGDQDGDAAPVGVLGNFLSNPALQQQLAIVIGRYASRLLGLADNEAGQPVAALSGTLGNEQDEEISAAIEILKKNDPQIAKHLTKLAMISLHQPDKFKMLLEFLNGL